MSEEPVNDKLSYMIEVFKDAPEIYKPSAFWQNLNDLHMVQLKKDGYSNFKRTLNLRYFNFIPKLRDDQYKYLLKYWVTHPTLRVLFSRFYNFSPIETGGTINYIDKITEGITYRLFVTLLWEYAKHIDKQDLLVNLQEPEAGNPLGVYYRKRLVSQDLCNSVIEYYSIVNTVAPDTSKDLTIAELGAGYGRLAYVFLKTLKCKYAIFDIPPALYIAQEYLESVFPNLKIFPFRKISNFSEIKSEYESANICFFTPDQINCLPSPQFDLFINISSLHEMTMPQIKNYINLINKYTLGHFYTKQWMYSVNRDDGITVSYSDYPIPPVWKSVYFRSCPVQSRFFEAMYEIK